VCFLFKNEFILQNIFRGLQCNLHCVYHSGQTFGQVLFSCLDAFVVDVSDYSGHLIRHLLNASEEFPKEWFVQFWEQVKVWWAEPTRLCRGFPVKSHGTYSDHCALKTGFHSFQISRSFHQILCARKMTRNSVLRTHNSGDDLWLC
jgi:hypothetical protein